MKKVISIVAGISVLIVFLGLPLGANSRHASPIHIEIATSKDRYAWKEPVSIQVRVYNCDEPLGEKEDCSYSHTLATQQGFFSREWNRGIRFTAPDGSPVYNRVQNEVGREPPGTFRFKGNNAVFAELVPPGVVKEEVLPDAGKQYDLGQHGVWYAQIAAPLQVFDYHVDPATGSVIGFYPPRESFNPLRSNKVKFQVGPKPEIQSQEDPWKAARSQIDVYCDLLKREKGEAGKLVKLPMAKIRVMFYRSADVPEYFKPVTWKTYDQVVQNVRPCASGISDAQGVTKFFLEKGDYVVIAETALSPNFRYLGGVVGIDEPNWHEKDSIKVWLRAFDTGIWDSKYKDWYVKTFIAGKTRHFKDEGLLISEPEFVTWSDTIAPYPFFYEGINTGADQEVGTTLYPPAGFRTNVISTTTTIKDHLRVTLTPADPAKGIQFFIALGGASEDQDPEWKETEVFYRVPDRSGATLASGVIGLALTPVQAQKSGVGVFGHTTPPIIFSGGKPVD